MTWHFPSYATAYLVNAFFAALSCYFAWRRRSIPGVTAFVFLMLAIVAWTSFQTLEVMAVETWAKILWAKLGYLGIGSVGILWLLFSARFSNQDGVDYREGPRIALGNTDTDRPDGLHQ